VASDARQNLSATRHPIPFFGTGLLAEIADTEILRRADPDDLDHDGISGRANYDRGFVGRFGRKSQTVSIEGFIRGPLFNHLGLTSNPLSLERKQALPVPSGAPTTAALLRSWLVARASAQVAAPEMPNHDDDGVPDPELSEQDLFDLVSFAMLLAPPMPDAQPSAEAQAGHTLFRNFGCASCHVEDLAGPGGLVPAYSDLLLHDMGDALADGVVMGLSSGREFRTQPLWGIAATGPWLHDGRASTLDAAIRAHAGEGEAARRAYVAASEGQRGNLRAFLQSLGGRELASEGLLPPGAPMPAVGSAGGPRMALDDAGQAQFARGRALFDRDLAIEQGLGPTFNGDSCRACHFDPVVGGAGPGDVDVLRQAHPDGSLPSGRGSMLHRHGNDAKRPLPDPECTLFERRQTPTLLGLGLIDDIDAAAIEANADELDSDGDGISGRVRRLDDGRVGRFGWKANVPTVADFARDGMSNELGITLPASDSPFGTSHDADGVPDPELDAAALSDLTFFLRELAAPPRDLTVASVMELAAGQTLFDGVGCASCHRPTLPARDGSVVPLYSDLLLHDVGGATYRGIADGSAAPRELRTPPLWGLHATAPYLHDGSASTLELAISAHASEAERARSAYEQLSGTQRASLLSFLRSL
jgi:CxxC motif-containing protein (DUF1111 family)